MPQSNKEEYQVFRNYFPQNYQQILYLRMDNMHLYYHPPGRLEQTGPLCDPVKQDISDNKDKSDNNLEQVGF